MRGPERLGVDLVGLDQADRLAHPVRRHALDERRDPRMRPGRTVRAVGHRAHGIFGKHALRRLRVLARHAVDEGAEIERQARHVQAIGSRQQL